MVIVRRLIIPQQQGTSASCMASESEEDTNAMLDASRFVHSRPWLFRIACCSFCRGYVNFGWIHTHPHWGRFLSSTDMHNQLNYQFGGAPFAIAIVVAEAAKLSKRASVVYHLTVSGVNAMKECKERTPHEHPKSYFEVANFAILSGADPHLQCLDLRHSASSSASAAGASSTVAAAPAPSALSVLPPSLSPSATVSLMPSMDDEKSQDIEVSFKPK
jgi:hypothetical protein